MFKNIILLCIVNLFFSSCSPLSPVDKEMSNNYYYDEGGIVYCLSGQILVGKKKLVDVDINSFLVIGADIAKDKDHVYHTNTIIEGANPDSFELLSYHWGKDRDVLYFFYNYIDKYIKIDGMSTSNIRIMKDLGGDESNFLQSDTVVYFMSYSLSRKELLKVPVKHLESFIVLSSEGDLAKDADYVYQGAEVIDELDAASTNVIDFKWLRDENRLMFFSCDFQTGTMSHKLFVSDLKGWTLLNKPVSSVYGKDKTRIFILTVKFEDSKIIESKDADISSIHILQDSKGQYSSYWKDANRVYYYEWRSASFIPLDVNYNSFRVTDSYNTLATDGLNEYKEGVKVE